MEAWGQPTRPAAFQTNKNEALNQSLVTNACELSLIGRQKMGGKCFYI